MQYNQIDAKMKDKLKNLQQEIKDIFSISSYQSVCFSLKTQIYL